MFFNTCSTLRTNIHKFKGQRSHCAHTVEKKNEYIFCRKVFMFTGNTTKKNPLVLIEFHPRTRTTISLIMMVQRTVNSLATKSWSPSNFIFHQLPIRISTLFRILCSEPYVWQINLPLFRTYNLKKSSCLPINQIHCIHSPLFLHIPHQLSCALLTHCCSIIYANKLIHLQAQISIIIKYITLVKPLTSSFKYASNSFNFTI